MLRLLLRQPARPAGGGDISTADLEMIDRMDEAGIEPGQEFTP